MPDPDAAEALDLGSGLQELVEAVAHEFGRPVVVGDRQFHILAHSEHTDEVDHPRLVTILKQQVPAGVPEWVAHHQPADPREPFRVPGNPQLGLYERVAVPLRAQERLLGYLWFLDKDSTMTDEELERAGGLASIASAIVYREILLHQLGRSQERELVRDLLGPDLRLRQLARTRLLDEELVSADGAAVVIVADTTVLPLPSVEGDPRVAVDGVLAAVRRRLLPRHALHLARPDHALLVVLTSEPTVRREGVARVAELLRQGLSAHLSNGAGKQPIAAVGGRVDGLLDVAVSYQQAMDALAVARQTGAFGDIPRWDDLGAYKLLAQLPLDSVDLRDLHPQLDALTNSARGRRLAETLECYLDHAGDVKVTAEKLHLHRTSLYGRLKRIESVLDVDLSDGDDRLVMHLMLKLRRLRALREAS